MNGVEILTQAQVATEWAFNWTAFWIAFGIITFVVFIVGLAYLADDLCLPIVIANFIISLIAGTLLGVFIGVIGERPTAHETQYKVTITDEVSMTEFCEHYEVIDHDGKIFTVREKTNE